MWYCSLYDYFVQMFSVMPHIYQKSGVDESLSSVLFVYYLCRTLCLSSSITSAVLYFVREKFDAMCIAKNTSLLVLYLPNFLADKK